MASDAFPSWQSFPDSNVPAVERGRSRPPKGTGVLVKHRELIGMTCAHVDKQGDDVGKGRADIRGLARCPRLLR